MPFVVLAAAHWRTTLGRLAGKTTQFTFYVGLIYVKLRGKSVYREFAVPSVFVNVAALN